MGAQWVDLVLAYVPEFQEIRASLYVFEYLLPQPFEIISLSGVPLVGKVDDFTWE